MSNFSTAISEGLRIEVENDLYRDENQDDEMDKEEIPELPSMTVTQEKTSAPIASPPPAGDADSDKEDGELSVHGSPAPCKCFKCFFFPTCSTTINTF